MNFFQIFAFLVVQILLANGVDTDEWFTAVKARDTATVKRMLTQNGTELLSRTSGSQERFAIHYASMYGNRDVLKALIDAGANIEATDNLEMTALHYAVHFNQQANVQILVDAGANVDARTDTGQTLLNNFVCSSSYPDERLLSLVIAGARADALQLLIQPNPEQKTEFVLKVELDSCVQDYPIPSYWNGQQSIESIEIVLKLIAAGVRVDILQLFAYLGRLEQLQQLKDAKNVMPTAVECNNVEFIEFLVENGKVIEVYNSTGAKTELYWALLHSSMEVLLMEDVDWNAQLEYHKHMYNSISIPNSASETTKPATGNATDKDKCRCNDQQQEVVYCNNLTPGLRRFASGIDITTLDLFPLDSTEVDGFKKPLLDYTCNKGRTWKDDDNVFDLPDQINSLQRVPTGWTHANTEIFRSRDEVKKSMAKNVHLEESSGTNIDLKTPKFDISTHKFGISIPSFQLKLHETKGSFSRTHSVRKMSESIELHEKTIAKATSFISIYKAMIDAKAHFEPSQPLRLAIDNLPSTIDYSTMPVYIEFIKEYGTHFFTEAKFGGYLMQISTISSVYASKHSDEQLKEKETSFFEEKLVWMNKENSKSSEVTNDQSEADEEFRKNIQAKMYFYGGDPRAQNLEWFDTVSGSPWLFSGKLEPIYKLIENEEKQKSMMRALESYMKSARAAEMGPRFDAEICAFAFGDGCSAPRENCARVNQWTVPVTFREENGSQCRMNWKLKVASPENWMEQGVKLCFKYSAHRNSNCSGSDHHPSWKIETPDKIKTLLSSPATDNETHALINCADVNDWTSKYIHYIGEGCRMTWSMFAVGNEGDDIPEWMEEFYFCWRTLTFEGKYNVDCAPVMNRYLSHFYKEGGQTEGRQLAWGLFAQDLSTEN